MVEEVKKPALPEPKECELVARELAKNQVEKISDVRSRLNMTWLQIWPIICYMEEQGILEKGKEGTVTLTRTPEQIEELEILAVETVVWGRVSTKTQHLKQPGKRRKDAVHSAYPKGKAEQSRCECHYHRPEAGI
ncbi:MAG: hypothetical protein ACLVFM_10380 [Blautia faecis]